VLKSDVSAALRVFRACFRSSNGFITRHLIKHDGVLPIIELTAREARRDNMLSSTCQEFFEYIRRVSRKLSQSQNRRTNAL
jgi:protein phosphatase-4 regulatory subunit 3